MKITIVTLYRGKMAEHYVGGVEGSLTDEQRHELADRFEAHYHSRNEGDEEDSDEEEDYMCFREVDLSKDPTSLVHLMNIDDDGITLNQFGSKTK